MKNQMLPLTFQKMIRLQCLPPRCILIKDTSPRNQQAILTSCRWLLTKPQCSSELRTLMMLTKFRLILRLSLLTTGHCPDLSAMKTTLPLWKILPQLHLYAF